MHAESYSRSPRVDTPNKVVVAEVKNETDAEIAQFALDSCPSLGMMDSYFSYEVKRWEDTDTVFVYFYKD